MTPLRIVLIVFLVLGLALVCALGAPLAYNYVQRVAAPAPEEPSPPQYQPPTAPEAPAAPTANCLPLKTFAKMWSASKASDGPGPLIELLNNSFDMSNGTVGTQWPVGPQTVEPVSVVWTDLLQHPMPAASGKWVPLRTQGQWGVFAVYTAVTVPTPGRSARLCQSLDPARDLAGW